MGAMPGNPRGAAWPSWIMHQTRSATQSAPSLEKPADGQGDRVRGLGRVATGSLGPQGRLCLHAPPDQNKRRGLHPERSASVREQTNK